MDGSGKRIYLSAPTISKADVNAVVSALESGWVAPAGPELAKFEAEIAQATGAKHGVALASGTAGLHLSLKAIGVAPGDVVLVPTMTFAATAFAVTYLDASPVFIDIDSSGCMDPEVTKSAIKELRRSGCRIAAAIPVDLYGSPADYDSLISVFTEFEIPVIEDAAEGLGGNHAQGPIGSFGNAAVISFNGNKIMTTSGGGMVTTNDDELAARIRHWSTQSREPYPWYEHVEVGYNYRMSNVLAALGRSQLSRLTEIVESRRSIRQMYTDELGDVADLAIQGDPPWGRSNGWLTVARFSRKILPGASPKVREHLAGHGIESRPVWKPMHQQPVFAKSQSFLSGSADMFFEEGLCLPSGTDLQEEQIKEIAGYIKQTLR